MPGRRGRIPCGLQVDIRSLLARGIQLHSRRRGDAQAPGVGRQQLWMPIVELSRVELSPPPPINAAWTGRRTTGSSSWLKGRLKVVQTNVELAARTWVYDGKMNETMGYDER